IKYAIAIQKIQEDMGIKTASFPHLGLYGDVLVLNNKKDERVVFEDPSALEAKQEEYEKWQAEKTENAKKIQEVLQKPDEEKGESIETIADDLFPSEMVDYEQTVPELLQQDEEKGESIETIADDLFPSEMVDYEQTVPELLQQDEEKGE